MDLDLPWAVKLGIRRIYYGWLWRSGADARARNVLQVAQTRVPRRRSALLRARIPREGGIIEEIRLETAIHNDQRAASMLDLILYDRCQVEPNLQLMLNTRVVDVELQGERIALAVAERQSTEDRFQIGARIFVDCTGDGQMGVSAGAAYQHGREGKNVYGESWAAEHSDGKTLGSTSFSRRGNMTGQCLSSRHHGHGNSRKRI